MDLKASFNAVVQDRLNQLSRVPLYVVALFAIYLITLTGTAILNYRHLQTLRQDNDWMARAWETKRQLKNVAIALIELENNVRGYFISQDSSYLHAWETMPERAENSFDLLERLVQDEPLQRRNLQQLKTLYQLKIRELQDSIDAFDSNDVPDPALPVILDRGRAVMADLLTLDIAMQGIESDSITDRRDHYFHESNEAMWIGIAINAMAILILVLFYRLIGISVARQRAIEEQLKASNDNLESTVQIRTQQLSVLSRHLLNVREEEKAKLARELHDELGASLTAIGMDISSVRDKLQRSEPALAKQLMRAKQTLVDTIDLKRRIIENLRPSMLDNLGLAASIRHHCEQLGKISGLKYQIDMTEEFDDIDPPRAIALFRITQEALNNTIKYAQAESVKIALHRSADGLRLLIQDDGIGIAQEVLDRSISHGLLGMRERALLLGGRFSIGVGVENRGCSIEVFLPFAQQQSA